MRTGYETGTWWALIGQSSVLALPPDVDDALMDRLWDVLETGSGFAEVVDVLTAHVGGAFAAIPPFVAVVREGEGVRVAVRGLATARVSTVDGETTFTGAEVTTWSEHYVAGGTEAEILLDEAVRGRLLPVGGGIVAAARITLEFGVAADAIAARSVASAASVPAPAREQREEVAPEPAIEPEPEAETSSQEEKALSVPEGAAPIGGIDEPPVDPFEALGLSHAVHESEPAEDEDVESTIVSSATLVPVPDAESAPPTVGDHDGATISVAQLRALRGQSEGGALPPAPAAPDAPTVALSLRGRIRVSTGQVVELDRPVIIGRRPRSTRASGDNMPHLVPVDSPQQDISRNHLEVRPDAGSCVVIDLHTTNGSTLLRVGAEPVRLHPGEQTVVVTGDTVDLGDGVTITFEDLP